MLAAYNMTLPKVVIEIAGSLTDTFEADILKAVTGQATTILTTTPFTQLWLSLFTVAPTDSTAGTEAAGGGYARLNTIGKWGAPTGTTQVANNAILAFTTFTGPVSSLAPFVAFGLHTLVTAGTMTAWGTLTDQTKTGGNGDTVSFAISALVLTCD